MFIKPPLSHNPVIGAEQIRDLHQNIDLGPFTILNLMFAVRQFVEAYPVEVKSS